MEKKVRLLQCLCPRRHCILAAAYLTEDDATARRLLEERMLELKLNPWCALCRAPREQWVYEVAETEYTDMRAIAPVLLEATARNVLTRLMMEEKFAEQRN